MQTLQQLVSGELLGIKKLILSCGLTQFPPEIFSLADTLEVLDLSDNHLSQLPDDFSRLKNLKIVFFYDNDFTTFPTVLSQCAQLDIIGFNSNKITHIPENALPINVRWLILTNNRLEALPKTIGQCLRLQKMMLAGNRLKGLPEEMAACRNLELLRISANEITELPAWLFTLPRLSWFAFAGNPCSVSNEINASLNEIAWEELELTKQLGAGASGIITKANWQSKTPGMLPKEVAVKIFKGKMTSDGLPADEMNVCISAGSHPNLVTVLGKTYQHPEHKQGLVFELIPPTFHNLGHPPNFKTCTRDIFTDGTVFSIHQIITIAFCIASAASHLHERGILHGDLYAHNILTDEAANALFGDLGAATIYNTDHPQKMAIERLEVSAFGYLLDDLLTHAADETSGESITTLTKLQLACVQPSVLERPSFNNILEQIRLIKTNL